MFKIWIIWSNWFLWQSILNKLINKEEFLLTTFNRSIPKYDFINVKSYVWEISNESKEFLDFIKQNYDLLIHLWEKPTYDINYLLSRQLYYNKILFDNIKDNKEIKKVIYLSSMAVYWEWINKKENDILNPINNYWFVKKISENIFLDLINYKKNVIIFRPSNLYWIWSNSWAIYNFINNINNNKEIIINWNWEQKRDFLYIDDCSDAILSSIHYNKNWIFNISSWEINSLKNILDILKNHFNIDFRVNFLESDENNFMEILSEDISLIKEELWWTPKINILEWLSKILWKKYM